MPPRSEPIEGTRPRRRADSPNACDSLAEAYKVKGEKALAVESYEKSLELNPTNEEAAKQLREPRGPEKRE